MSFWRHLHWPSGPQRPGLMGPKIALEIVITGYDNGVIDWDTMSFHGEHTPDDMRALLTGLLMVLTPQGPPNVRTIQPPTPLLPQGELVA